MTTTSASPRASRPGARTASPLTAASSALGAVGDWAWWFVSLSAFWIVATLAGGIVLGVAPASLAAATLVRERDLARHDRVWRDGIRFWVQGFARSQAAVLPLTLLTAALGVNYVAFSALGPEATAPRLTTLGALLFAGTALAWTAPIAAHYAVRPWRVSFLATRMLLARPFSSILLAFVATVLVFAVAAAPVLVVAAIGVWWSGSTLLCLRFFRHNESARHDAPDSDGRTPLGMPVQPLRID